jgi:hypothetical protein
MLLPAFRISGRRTVKVEPHELGFPLATTDINRGDGIHASHIYSDFANKLHPTKYTEDMDPITRDLLFTIGLAWEQYLEKVLVANGVMCQRPGELESPEGIKYSPDLLIINGDDRLGEIKATYKSSRDCVPGNDKFDRYLLQTKLYCYWTGIPRCRFYVLYLHGNYIRGPEGKMIDFKAWDIEFTKRELKENYTMLMNHARGEDLFAKAEAGLL